ncbi:MAG: ParB N-terminal domain-containing protein, partial [Paracoccaceae bacterium]
MTKQEQITKAPAIEYIPLADLYLSDLNPRQEVDEAETALLADSIATCGLIQNLSGLRDQDGKFGIVAGGRRLRALQLAVKTDPSLDPVPVRLAPDAKTAETWANVENAARVDLHPADEIRAFAKMFGKDASVGKIANAFATTEAHVYRRLALGVLPEAVLDALQSGAINLSMASAFTLAESEASALEVLEQVQGFDTSAHRIKSMLKPDAIRGSDRLAVFVGQRAYEQRGGPITRDLFSDEVAFDDPVLLQAMVEEDLAKAVEQATKDGWKWAETSEQTYVAYWELEQNGYRRVRPVQGVLGEEQAERYEALAELANGDELDEADSVELDGLQIILDGEFTEDQRAYAGTLFYVNQSGSLAYETGLIRREDVKEAIVAGVLSKPTTGAGGDVAKSPYSQKLQADLAIVGCGARQNALLDHPDLVLDLLAFQMAERMGYRQAFGLRKDDVANQPGTETGYSLDDRLTTPAPRLSDPFGSDLARGFRGFRKKGKKHMRAELTRHLVAQASLNDQKLADQVDKEVDAGIRAVWTPTAKNFFGRVKAAYLEGLWRDLLDLKPDHPTVT